MFGRSFARVTGNAINKEIVTGHSLPPKDRFTTSNIVEFNKNNFRRIKDAEDPAEVKDKRDQNNFHDSEYDIFLKY